MADFKHPFIDFSRGEVEDKLLVLSTSQDDRKSVSFSENGGTTKTKGLARRTGTIKEVTVRWPVATVSDSVRNISIYVGKGKTFLANMYVVRYGDLTTQQKIDYADLVIDLESISNDQLFLHYDFYSDNGVSLTFVNEIALAVDFTRLAQIPRGSYPNVLSNDWTDISGFRFTKYRNFLIFAHDSGDMEPFVIN